MSPWRNIEKGPGAQGKLFEKISHTINKGFQLLFVYFPSVSNTVVLPSHINAPTGPVSTLFN